MMNIEFVNDDMEVVASAFDVAFKTVMNQYLDDKIREKLLAFVASISVEEKPWMWASPEGQAHLLELVMVEELTRDFIMSLTYAFFSRWGEASVKFTGMTDSLSWGISADVNDNETKPFVLMPQDISSRLTSRADVKNYLNANKWVVTLLLIKLFIVPESLMKD